jgi:hypothetical protein
MIALLVQSTVWPRAEPGEVVGAFNTRRLRSGPRRYHRPVRIAFMLLLVVSLAGCSGLGSVLQSGLQAGACVSGVTSSAPQTTGTGMITLSAPAGTALELCVR